MIVVYYLYTEDKKKEHKEEVESGAPSTDPHALLRKFGLDEYSEVLIHENGYSDTSYWPQLDMYELTESMGFEKVDAKKFKKCVAELKL